MASRKKARLQLPGKTGEERRKEGGKIHIEFTALDEVRSNRADRRQESIDNGTLHANKGGFHGGGKRSKRRADRKGTKQELRRAARNGGSDD